MMECNKDEAVRARDLAEKKMQAKDFVGAKKFASKAQQLCPDLDGIIQMQTVCEVHCAAEIKINGADDFYSILQVQPGAEELLIKKQYKKLCLLLHPDKNKFPGAEAAFKLIGEANRILTDQSKRSYYDIKRNTTVGVVKTKLPAQHANTARFPNGQNMRNRFENVHFNSMHNEQQQQTNTAPTFWTSCPFCRIRYQYYRTIMNRSLRCQNCMKPFVAYDLNSQNAASGASGYPHVKCFSGQHAYDNNSQFNQNHVAGRPATSQPSQHVGAKADHVRKSSNIEKDEVRGGADGKVDDIKYEKVKLEETNRKEEPSARASGSLNKKRNRSTMESGDREKQKDGSCIRKNEDGKSENVFEVQTSPHVDADVCGAVPSVTYPDPEFHDFDLQRNANSFAVGQIWALYDNLDGMPRYYARIRNVVTTGFKVRFIWLEHNPDCQPGIDWSEKELPVGSGNFILGSSQTSKELPMFSHQMVWDKGHQKGSYVIRPRKNEIWALLKNWDMKWAYEADARKSFEYEIVEIFSGDVDSGVTVMPLVKVAGFTSVFARPRCEPALLTIPPDERLRFSHMIPSHKLSGSEREGVPAGSYELDPVSLPVNFDKIYPSVSYKIDAKIGGQDAVKNRSSIELDADVKPTSCQTTSNKSEELPNVHVGRPLRPNCDQEDNKEAKLHDETKVTDINSSISKQDKRNGVSPSYPKDLLYEYPEPEFHDFGSVKSFDKIQSGQIWALYCDIDGFPKYYAVIKDVDVNGSKISLNWLEGCPLQEDEIKWAEKELPLSCGLFKASRGKNNMEVYTSLEAFSHLVLTKPSEKKHRYEIYPRVGEVWALYRKWATTWEESDMCNCEFDVVEILNTENSIQVQYMSKLKGHNSVFKPKQVNAVIAKAEIPRDKMLQFSHCIPSFRMTEERWGKLRGYWELDPAAVPELLFCS